ncbi:hypothetical protein HAX54_025748 [Datura stramonium]|uniref:Peptidase A1 domain-containing protein n=1 Tax=Datura stramonium TaxID=4076 RepID=A0ABS8V088_DATST|nr:hypothetical protein [Datura stramonium]
MFVPLQRSLLLLLLVFFILSVAYTTTSYETKTSTGHAIPFPTHEQLDVKQSIKESTLIHPPITKTHDEKRNSTWKLKLLHRDKMPFSHFTHHTRRFQARIRRDLKRVHTLTIPILLSWNRNLEVTSFRVWIKAVENTARIGAGSPVREQYMVIDAGSDIVWVHASLVPIATTSPTPHLTLPFRFFHRGALFLIPLRPGREPGLPCRSLQVPSQYGDGSYTKGTMALETILSGRTVVRDVAIGCGHSNRGMFIGAAGLLGLGGGSMSFVGQLGGQTGESCLLFDAFRLTEEGDGGVVMDTGTAVTRLPRRRTGLSTRIHRSNRKPSPRAAAVSIFDTYMDLNGFVTVRVPNPFRFSLAVVRY